MIDPFLTKMNCPLFVVPILSVILQRIKILNFTSTLDSDANLHHADGQCLSCSKLFLPEIISGNSTMSIHAFFNTEKSICYVVLNVDIVAFLRLRITNMLSIRDFPRFPPMNRWLARIVTPLLIWMIFCFAFEWAILPDGSESIQTFQPATPLLLYSPMWEADYLDILEICQLRLKKGLPAVHNFDV